MAEIIEDNNIETVKKSISKKFAIFKNINIAKIFINSKGLLKCNIIINTFYTSNKILSTN